MHCRRVVSCKKLVPANGPILGQPPRRRPVCAQRNQQHLETVYPHKNPRMAGSYSMREKEARRRETGQSHAMSRWMGLLLVACSGTAFAFCPTSVLRPTFRCCMSLYKHPAHSMTTRTHSRTQCSMHPGICACSRSSHFNMCAQDPSKYSLTCFQVQIVCDAMQIPGI